MTTRCIALSLGQPAPMLTFVALCLLCRVAYTFNDVLVGELAREHDGTEVGALRGLSLGLTMSPLLLFVAPGAWGSLVARAGELALLCLATALANVLHLYAARHLPFGLRAALLVAGVALGGLVLGAAFLGERLGATELVWCVLIVASAVLAALGDHSTEGLTTNLRKGAFLTLAASALLGLSALLFARLARATDPLLVAWAWELGAGAALTVSLIWRSRGRLQSGILNRFVTTGVRSLPTVVGTGASALALTRGPLGVWAALAGTQALLSAGLGAVWHRERLGARRWSYFVLGALGIAGLALTRTR